MVIAIPGGIGCMSWLQEQLTNTKGHVYSNCHFKDAIDDFQWFAADVYARSTQIVELMPKPLIHMGCSNAAGPGIGGV